MQEISKKAVAGEGMLVCDAVNSYLLYCTRHSHHTQGYYRRTLQRLSQYLPVNIGDISAEHLEKFIIISAKCKKNSSVNVEIDVIKSWLGWMEDTYGTANPAAKIKYLKASPPAQRVLSQGEYEILRDRLSSQRYKDIIMFLCHTGLRRQEFLSLTPSNISNNMLHIEGKGRNARSIPLNKTAAEIAQRTNLNMIKSLDRNRMLYICRLAAKEVDIPVFTPHSCRHYFATALHQKNVPIGVIAKLLGHASIETTIKIYIHIWDDDLIGITDCLE